MEPRLNYAKLSPEPVKALSAVVAYVAGSGLEHSLVELVKVRASQVNGCAFCLDMHTQDARAAGETEPAALRPIGVAGDAVLQRPGAGGPLLG